MTAPAVAFSDADWEGAAKERLGELDWKPLDGQAIAPGTGERESWAELLVRPGFSPPSSASTRKSPPSTCSRP